MSGETPTKNETSDNAWARGKVQEWISNVEGNYLDTQRLARVHPIALGVYCVGILYGQGERDFTGAELREMREALRFDSTAQMMVELASGDRPDGVDHTENSTRGYVADYMARRDVQGIDWAQLALDILDVEAGDADPRDWAREDHDPDDEPEDDEPDPEAMSRLARRALGIGESAPE